MRGNRRRKRREEREEGKKNKRKESRKQEKENEQGERREGNSTTKSSFITDPPKVFTAFIAKEICFSSHCSTTWQIRKHRGRAWLSLAELP